MRCAAVKPVPSPKSANFRMAEARRFTIRGRVQGVWFRDSTRREALALSLSGSARNLGNGDVEVMAYGDSVALDALATWLHNGPPLARVTGVVTELAKWQDVSGFTIA
jgi:acylphosphatase